MEYFPLYLSSLNSTNNYASELLRNGDVAENTVILSDYQDDGKGQGGNKWISEGGKNLLMSWIVYPAFLTVSDQFMLSKAVSLGIIDTLEELGMELQIKWPNDIICNRRKLGGILIENSILGNQLQHSIIGIGLNVNQITFPAFPFPATSIKNEIHASVSVPELSELLMPHLLKRYSQLKSGNHLKQDTAYAERLFRRNVLGVFEIEGKRIEAKIKGVNEFGELELDISGSTRFFPFHSIRMIH